MGLPVCDTMLQAKVMIGPLGPLGGSEGEGVGKALSFSVAIAPKVTPLLLLLLPRTFFGRQMKIIAFFFITHLPTDRHGGFTETNSEKKKKK